LETNLYNLHISKEFHFIYFGFDTKTFVDAAPVQAVVQENIYSIRRSEVKFIKKEMGLKQSFKYDYL
jgi:uncharacterized protein YhbP (UPF0306 family)